MRGDSLPELARALGHWELPLPIYIADLEREFNRRQAQIHAFLPEGSDPIDRFQRLRRAAIDLVRRFPHPTPPPPLYGVPVGIKDVFHIEGFPTRAGSRLPPEELDGEEGYAVARLRQAGAMIFGKTVCTEFAYLAPGPTRNPLNTEHTPGGSSSGSAAAVAAGLTPLALGTQTIGSICRPAAFCGVAGFKPSYDRISRGGVFPLAPSYDHVGWFTSDVTGAYVAASVIIADWREVPGQEASGLRLAIPEGPLLERAEPVGREHFQEVVQQLREAGAIVERVPALEDLTEIEARHEALLAAQAAEVHEDLYARHADLYRAETVALLEQGLRIPPDRVEEARQAREPLRKRLVGQLEGGDFDAWICPSAPGPAPEGLESTGDPVMNRPWTQAGLPAISIPSGYDDWGLPLGLQLIGRFRQDEELLTVARAVETVLEDNPPPRVDT